MKLVHAPSKKMVLGALKDTLINTGNQCTPLAIPHCDSRISQGCLATHPLTGRTMSAQTIQSRGLMPPTRCSPGSLHHHNTSSVIRRLGITWSRNQPGNSQAQPTTSRTPPLSNLIAQHGRKPWPEHFQSRLPHGTLTGAQQQPQLASTPVQSNQSLCH
jgi:hypothetical protein